jgi:hypothetical protein
VWRLETTAAGTEYGAWIMDTDTGDETMIGTIMVPNTWGGISSNVVLFSEWYGGEFPSCRSMPRSNVLFGIPTADAGDATATFTGQVDVGGACPGTFTDWGTGIQEMLPR